MFQYARPNITPRSGYVYTDPDTGVDFRADYHQALVDAVARHRRANKLVVPANLSAVIEDYICRLNPPTFRKGEGRLSRPLPPSARDAVSNTLRLLKGSTGPIVEQSVVRDRAKICRACEHNGAEPCCYSCSVESVFSPIVGAKHQTLSTTMIGLCGVDKTFSKAILWIPGSRTADAEYPDSCWKNGCFAAVQSE